MRVNLPNQITLARLGLAVVFFALLSTYSAARFESNRWLLTLCFWIFLIAALGDILDGLLARALRQVTSLGRILDPVVDKIMVCGAFVFFASGAFVDPVSQTNITGVAPWMVVVILLRELLVSALRSFSEAGGQAFPATWVGKLKMFVQSATVCVILGQLAWLGPGWSWLRIVCVWLTVVVSAASVVAYVRRAAPLLFSAEALGGAAPTEERTTLRDKDSAVEPPARATPGGQPTFSSAGATA
jgi:CDP-diacylglycerol--glycerol-3-phosphate 3-phosphatidyltransferase